MRPANRNVLWARVIVDELARSGLRHVVIAPGSRSTPLTLAFADEPSITVHSLVDERSAGFFALGLALASERPVALVCSSGTATANFHPAVIEAHYAQVPLLVLTADRPPELRESGANQTIDQVRLYGEHVLWSVDVALPEADPAPLVVRNLRTLACRAWAVASGTPNGPVHLNFPLRKPLEPTPVPTDVTDRADFAGRADGRPFVTFDAGARLLSAGQFGELLTLLRESPRGLIVCGPRCPGGDFPRAVTRLAAAAGYPILADPLSNVRFGPSGDALVLGGYDNYLTADSGAPDVILQFGKMPTARAAETYLDAATSAHRIAISADGVWADPTHRLDQFIEAEPALLCSMLASRLDEQSMSQPRDRLWVERLRAAETATWDTITATSTDDYFDGLVLADVVDLLPDGALLYVGNSLPVRHLDQFARPTNKTLRVFGNRGASGIDGVVSSALGAAAASDQPLTLVIGDLSFYHDLNGLLAVKRLGINATIVVLNNNGGGIFKRLPIASFEPPFTDLFRTPLDLDFEPVIGMYGLDYRRADDRASFCSHFAAAQSSDTATVIEVPTDAARDHEWRQTLLNRIHARITADLTVEGE